jgi:hypothetical protein
MIFFANSCSPRIDISNDVSYTPNGYSMPKLRPREIDVPIYPNGAHMTFGASSPRVRFLDVCWPLVRYQGRNENFKEEER